MKHRWKKSKPDNTPFDYECLRGPGYEIMVATHNPTGIITASVEVWYRGLYLRKEDDYSRRRDAMRGIRRALNVMNFQSYCELWVRVGAAWEAFDAAEANRKNHGTN